MSHRVLELAPGLRCAVAGNPGPLTLDGTRNYLVGHRSAVLLDPGPGGPEQAGRIEALLEGSRAVARVGLTHAHPDHAGGAWRLAGRLGAALAASEATLTRLAAAGGASSTGASEETLGERGGAEEGDPGAGHRKDPSGPGGGGRRDPAVRKLEEGDLLELDGGRDALRVIATPGHSPDHLSFLRTSDRAVFAGDLVLGGGSSLVGHPEGHMGSYLSSLERLRSLEPSVLYPGHGEPVREPVPRIEAYLAHRREREEQILAALEAGARSVAAVREEVYGPLEARLARAAEASIRAHLVHLEEAGRSLPTLEDR